MNFLNRRIAYVNLMNKQTRPLETYEPHEEHMKIHERTRRGETIRAKHTRCTKNIKRMGYVAVGRERGVDIIYEDALGRCLWAVVKTEDKVREKLFDGRVMALAPLHASETKGRVKKPKCEMAKYRGGLPKFTDEYSRTSLPKFFEKFETSVFPPSSSLPSVSRFTGQRRGTLPTLPTLPTVSAYQSTISVNGGHNNAT